MLALHHAGTPALTSRGFVEEDFAKVADFFDAAVKLAVKIKAATTGHSKSYFFFFSLKKYLDLVSCPGH